MSGHSKWSTIKRQKASTDAKRGQAFTKMGKAITVAVREGGGGDPASNFKLRLAMDQARAINMPKENINRAIERGLGRSGDFQMETVVYEAYAPGRVALMIEAATDNKNRTTPEIRGIIEKSGGTFASPGAVSWMFRDTGQITLKKLGKSFDEIFDAAVAAGADDVVDGEDFVEVYCNIGEIENVKNYLTGGGFEVEGAEISKIATTLVEIKDSDTAGKIISLIEKIEERDDVLKVYANFDVLES